MIFISYFIAIYSPEYAFAQSKESLDCASSMISIEPLDKIPSTIFIQNHPEKDKIRKDIFYLSELCVKKFDFKLSYKNKYIEYVSSRLVSKGFSRKMIASGLDPAIADEVLGFGEESGPQPVEPVTDSQMREKVLKKYFDSGLDVNNIPMIGWDSMFGYITASTRMRKALSALHKESP